MRVARPAVWLVASALVVLCARTLAYAVRPSPLAVELRGAAGGPGLPLICLVSLALGLAVAAATVWLAAIGVDERRRLEARPLLDAPRLRVRVAVARALGLFAVSAPAFGLVESYIHWRAGLGWHGMHCLVGPVHRDAIPILAALSLIAAALVSAIELVVRWMRRTLAELGPAPTLAVRMATPRPLLPLALLGSRGPRPLGARGPPLALGRGSAA